MRKMLMAVLAAALCAGPVMAMAAPAKAAQAKAAKAADKTPAKTAMAPSHSTTGTVKSMTNDSLVITRPGKKGGDLTFTLNSATQKTGSPESGSKVTVRYREEGSAKIATAVMAQPAQTAKKK